MPRSTTSIIGPSNSIKTHQLALHTCFKFRSPFLGLCLDPRHLIPHPTTSSVPTMSSTTHTIKTKATINQMPLRQPVKTKKSKHLKKTTIHQSGSSLPPDDFALFPQDVIKEKHSSIRDAKPRKSTETKSAKRSSSPMPRHHVIEPKTAAPSRQEGRRPSRRSVCLEHMSTVNCTVDCANAEPLNHLKMPPKAPSPPRLPTPDLSDLEEDDLWSCCGSSWTSLSKESNRCNAKADNMWDEMGASSNTWHQGNEFADYTVEEKLTKAKAWQSRSSSASRKAALERRH